MQTYESVIVVNPKLSDQEVEVFAADVKNMISAGSGEILSEDKWGRRKLAYPIEKVKEGYYLYFKYKAPGELVNKLSHHFRLQETLLRTLTVIAEVPRKLSPKKAKKAKAAAAAPAAPAAAPAAL